jgi:outer membrane protein TolC
LGGTWNLFDSFATWHGINQAKQMNEAVGHQLDRTDQEIVFRVISSYYDVLLAAKELEVAEQSAKTSNSIMDRSQARFDSGLTVESDLLTAKVRMAARQQEMIRARNTLEVARAQLNTVMGVPLDSPFQTTELLAERTLPAPVLGEVEKQALANRPDLKRIASEDAAQRQSVSMAKSSFGPRVNAFAGWEMDNPTFVAGGGGNNWLGGIEVQFDIFQGGAKRAELSRQRALEEKVVAMKQSASDAVRLEVRRAYYETDANRQQIEVARAAIAQAQESLRINQDRYDSGLTTITDLLGAEDAARRSQTDYWEAVYHFQTSYANLELASGSLNPQSPVVMP